MQIKREERKMTSPFFRIHNLGRKYSILFTPFEINEHRHLLLWSQFLFYVAVKCGKENQKQSVTPSLYRLSSQRDTPAINLSL
jgi:hypothetical protein